MLLITNMFRSLLWPSSGYLITRIQQIKSNWTQNNCFVLHLIFCSSMENRMKLRVFYLHFFTIVCILMVFLFWQTNNGHRIDWNLLVKNNTAWLKIFIKVHRFVYRVSIKSVIKYVRKGRTGTSEWNLNQSTTLRMV